MKTTTICILILLLIKVESGFAQSGLNLTARVYLNGAFSYPVNYSSNGKPLMSDNLRTNPFNGMNYIPILDPYYYPMLNFDITSKYYHVEPTFNLQFHQILDSIAVFGTSGENAIFDWVFIELRSALDSTQIIATRSALVQRDGDVVDLDGTSSLFFPDVEAEQFYVVVKHRNHLGAMTKIVNKNTLVDFTDPHTDIYDFGYINSILDYTGLSQDFVFSTGYKALYTGDCNADGKIKFENPSDDLNVLYFDVLFHPLNSKLASNFNLALGYYNSDLDMNGKVKHDNPFDDKNTLYTQVVIYRENDFLISNYNYLIAQIPDIGF